MARHTPQYARTCLVAIAAITASCLPGCASLLSSIDWTGKAEDEPVDLRGELNFGDVERVVGSYVTVGGTGAVIIEGVGLVTGLDYTGGDVPPSAYRTNIKDDMKRRKIPAPDKMLASPTTAVVLVRAFIPPLHKKGDPLDIEVTLPPESEATSLRGGWLLPCSLYERRLLTTGTSLRGRELARTTGPVLISPTGDRDIKDAATLRKGTIPAGGLYIGDSLSLTLNLRTDYRSVRMAKRMADQIGHRFHGFDEYGIKRPLAEAKTDTRITLEIPEEYHDNHVRYLKVIRRIHLKETPVERRLRMEALRSKLADPKMAEEAAFELEAMGRDAMPILREALGLDSLYCRFQAAVALCYLGDEIGVPHLVEAARDDEALRVWAFLAMASLEGGEAIEGLSTLLDEESVETRYGAVRAITTVDPNHPAVAGRTLTERCVLRAINSKLPPVIHLTKSQKSEITLFGADQQFTLPLTARAGHHLLVTGNPGDGVVKVSRFQPGEEDRQLTVSPRIADVLAACAELGARYPDLVGLLVEADSQRNLPGPIAIDALPEAGRLYDGPSEEAAEEEPDSEPFRGFDADLTSETGETEESDTASKANSPEATADAEALFEQAVDVDAEPSEQSADVPTGPAAAAASPGRSTNDLPPPQSEPRID